MALYKVLEDSFIDGRLYKPGEQVEYSGDRIGPNLSYISGKKPKEIYTSTDFAIDPASVPDAPKAEVDNPGATTINPNATAKSSN